MRTRDRAGGTPLLLSVAAALAAGAGWILWPSVPAAADGGAEVTPAEDAVVRRPDFEGAIYVAAAAGTAGFVPAVERADVGEKGAVLVVRLVDRAGRRFEPDTYVTAYRADGDDEPSCRAVDGLGRIVGVRPGRVRVHAWSWHGQPGSEGGVEIEVPEDASVAEVEVTMLSTRELPVKLRLADGRSFDGDVRSLGLGADVPRFQTWLLPEEPRGPFADPAAAAERLECRPSTRSCSRSPAPTLREPGSFGVLKVPPQGRWTACLMLDSWVVQARPLSSEEPELVFTLDPDALRARLATLTLRVIDASDGTLMPTAYLYVDELGQVAPEGGTGALVRKVVPGLRTLVVGAEGYADANLTRVFAPSESADLGTLALDPVVPLKVRVVDASRHPCPMRLRIRPRGVAAVDPARDQVSYATCGGEHEVDWLGPGTYVVVPEFAARAHDGSLQSFRPFEFHLGASPRAVLDLQLRPTAPLRFAVPARGEAWRLTVLDDGDEVFRATFERGDEIGADLVPGRYRWVLDSGPSTVRSEPPMESSGEVELPASGASVRAVPEQRRVD